MKTLLRHFGSVKKLRAAAPAEIAEVKGIGPALATAIVGRLGIGSVERDEEQPVG